MERPLAYCQAGGCPARVVAGYCPAHAPAPRLERDRPNVEARTWYRTARWAALRRVVLVAAAYACAGCGAVQLRLEVDHIEPHRGNADRFWDRSNLQALCPSCHARKTNRGA
jgi:5-methylcytosine-specific restriction protein A